MGKPAAGTSGGACSAEQACDLMLCCGNSTPKPDQKFAKENLTSICASALTLVYEDDLGNEYTHVCNDMSTRLTAASPQLLPLSPSPPLLCEVDISDYLTL